MMCMFGGVEGFKVLHMELVVYTKRWKNVEVQFLGNVHTYLVIKATV